MKIGEVAEQSGVPPKTLRFWEGQGLIPGPTRTPAGYRAYGPEVLERLAFIRQAQAAGFRLEQIRQILGIGESGARPCGHVTELIATRLDEVETRIAELKRTRDHLTALGLRAAAQDPSDCRGYCSIITG